MSKVKTAYQKFLSVINPLYLTLLPTISTADNKYGDNAIFSEGNVTAASLK